MTVTKPIPIYEQVFAVLPSDIDELQHANNICYLRWMQEVALNHSDVLGWSTKRYLELGSNWVVRRHTIDYLQQGFLDDLVLAETWVSEMKNVSSRRRYRFTRISDGVVLATAETLWGFICFQTGRPTRVPKEIQDTFTLIQEAHREIQ